jgi:hypothetical protein
MGRYLYPSKNFESPDTTQPPGTSPVTGASATGHASTTSQAQDGGSEQKTCRWFDLSSAPGYPGPSNRTSTTLRITHSSSGSLLNLGASNLFRIEYSLDGGSNWLTAVQRLNFTSPEGPQTVTINLLNNQSISLVQIRDLVSASSIDPGDSATCVGTVSDIQIEVVSVDRVIMMM